MKLKNLPPFKVGDRIGWYTPVFRTQMIVLAVDRYRNENSREGYEWNVTFRWAGLAGWLDHKVFGNQYTEPARCFRRVK